MMSVRNVWPILLAVLGVALAGSAAGLDCTDLRVIPLYAERALLLEGLVSARSPNTGVGKRDRLKGFFSSPASSQPVAIGLDGRTLIATTSAEGVFIATITPPVFRGRFNLADPVTGKIFSQREFQLPASPSALIVSDVDDTILVSEVASKFRLVVKTLLRSVGSRQPVPGTPELYAALVGRPMIATSPLVFYLSGSPAALEKFLEKFLHRHRFPEGVVCLKESLQKEGLSSREYKLRWLKRLSGWYPDLPWLLFGDSGELDPEIYLDFLATSSVTARAVVIHLVKGKTRSPAEWKTLQDKAEKRKVPFILWSDIEILKKELRARGLLVQTP